MNPILCAISSLFCLFPSLWRKLYSLLWSCSWIHLFLDRKLLSTPASLKHTPPVIPKSYRLNADVYFPQDDLHSNMGVAHLLWLQLHRLQLGSSWCSVGLWVCLCASACHCHWLCRIVWGGQALWSLWLCSFSLAALAICLLCSHMRFRMAFSSSVKKVIEIFMGIGFGNMTAELGRWFRGWSGCRVSMRTRVQIPSVHVNAKEVW